MDPSLERRPKGKDIRETSTYLVMLVNFRFSRMLSPTLHLSGKTTNYCVYSRSGRVRSIARLLGTGFVAHLDERASNESLMVG